MVLSRSRGGVERDTGLVLTNGSHDREHHPITGSHLIHGDMHVPLPEVVSDRRVRRTRGDHLHVARLRLRDRSDTAALPLALAVLSAFFLLTRNRK